MAFCSLRFSQLQKQAAECAREEMGAVMLIELWERLLEASN